MNAHSFFIIFVIFYFFVVQTCGQPYGRLAQTLTLKKYSTMMEQIPSLKSYTKPDQVKLLRKSILSARNMLDIFVYAYPNKTIHKNKPRDIWSDVRKDLDRGYELIGAFQDLDHSGVPYTDKDVIRLRTPCLNWKKDFLDNSEKYNYLKYLRNPSYLTLFFRSYVPGFFWNSAGLLPELSLSGLQNLQKLLHGIISTAKTNYSELILLENITESENQYYFHSFRKLNRGILMMYDDFPSIFNSSKCDNFTTSLNTIQQIYDDLGKLNDLYVKYEYYIQKGDEDSAEKQKVEVISKWDSIVKWMTENNVPDHLDCLA